MLLAVDHRTAVSWYAKLLPPFIGLTSDLPATLQATT
jgi:hypothetical protein